MYTVNLSVGSGAPYLGEFFRRGAGVRCRSTRDRVDVDGRRRPFGTSTSSWAVGRADHCLPSDSLPSHLGPVRTGL